MKNLNMSLFSFSLLSTISAFATLDDAADIQELLQNSQVVLVKTSIPSVKVEVPVAPVTATKPTPANVEVAPAHASAQAPVKIEQKEAQFSIVSGLKKGVNYVISPIVAHPWIAALVATAGVGYAYKKGYIKQLLVKLGIKKEETKEAQVASEALPVA